MIAQNRERAQKLGDALAKVAAHPAVGNGRQRGMICAFDVTPAQVQGFSRRFFSEALQRELLLRPIGTTVYWMPPYVLTDEELAWLGETTMAVLERCI